MGVFKDRWFFFFRASNDEPDLASSNDGFHRQGFESVSTLMWSFVVGLTLGSNAMSKQAITNWKWVTKVFFFFSNLIMSCAELTHVPVFVRNRKKRRVW